MLYEFINFHRKELIKRCKDKVASRFQPSAIPPALEHGVPLLLEQIVDMLRIEELGLNPSAIASEVHLSSAEIGRTAAVHGAELLRQGFSIEQVVREYGDVCQAITGLTIEASAEISSDEFRTLTRCLDDAIADAVKSFGKSRQVKLDSESINLQARLEVFEEEHRRLVDIAMRAFSAIRTGNVALTGATGTLLLHTISQLNNLTEVAMPQIRLLVAPTPDKGSVAGADLAPLH